MSATEDAIRELVSVTESIMARSAEHSEGPDANAVSMLARAFPEFDEEFWRIYAGLHDCVTRREVLLVTCSFLQGYELARQRHA